MQPKREYTRRGLLAALVAAAVLSIGAVTGMYSTGPSSSDPTGVGRSPAPPTPPADGGRYDTPVDVVEALEAADIICVGYEAIAQPINALADGRCNAEYGTGGSTEVVIRIHVSRAGAVHAVATS